ncbi:MAG: EamA family transporter [Lachnospiraceae bacterium]|jgi:transporter family protein|nr:EamA family transporter [Lachnospiraceae bacterium]
MWLVFALASAIFAGAVSILAKIGIKDTDSDLVTALRTVVVIVFAWLMVGVVGSHQDIKDIDTRSLVFLLLSGLATGASWLCYFRALKLTDVSRVVPIDKSSTILTMILSFIILSEPFTLITIIAMTLLAGGTYLMLARRQDETGHPVEQTKESNKTFSAYKWLIYAVLSALFASMTAIFAKIGIVGVESNLGTAIRTVIVFIMAWVIVLVQGKHKQIKQINQKSAVFIALSGLATGLCWLCFYRALQMGPVSIVVPIDKLSIVVTILFSYFFLKEKLSKKMFLGLMLIVAGTLSLLI